MYGGLIASTDERTTHDQVVFAVEARQCEIVVQLVQLEPRQGALVIFAPLPRITKHIVEAIEADRTGVNSSLSPTG